MEENQELITYEGQISVSSYVERIQINIFIKKKKKKRGCHCKSVRYRVKASKSKNIKKKFWNKKKKKYF